MIVYLGIGIGYVIINAFIIYDICKNENGNGKNVYTQDT
jgi:hypothetical protein